MALVTKDGDDSVGSGKIIQIQQKKKSFLPGIEWLRSLFHRDSQSNSTVRTSSFRSMTATPFRSKDVSSQMKQVFRVIDSNGDGKISPAELQDVLRRLGHHKSAASKEAVGMVSVVDRDGDGLIGLDEFMQVVDVGGAGERDDEDLAEAFQVFDTNKDGYISAWELRKVLRGLRQVDGRCSLRQCARMIRAVDRNGDGRVDFEEFRMLMTAGRRPTPESS